MHEARFETKCYETAKSRNCNLFLLNPSQPRLPSLPQRSAYNRCVTLRHHHCSHDGEGKIRPPQMSELRVWVENARHMKKYRRRLHRDGSTSSPRRFVCQLIMDHRPPFACPLVPQHNDCHLPRRMPRMWQDGGHGPHGGAGLYGVRRGLPRHARLHHLAAEPADGDHVGVRLVRPHPGAGQGHPGGRRGGGPHRGD